jgi:glycosyltransferase involved in cell wall biosynthesis
LSKIKVVHLTSVHPPFDIRIFHKECKTLVSAGYEVVIVVPHDRDELVDGVQIRAVPKPEGRLERMRRTVWQIYRTALQEDAQVYHFHDPELIPVGLLLKLRGKQVVYDVHENVPHDILSKEYLPVYLRAFISILAGLIEILCATFFNKIIAATPAIACRFSPGRTIIVQNFPVPGELVPSLSSPYAARPPFICYVGVIEVMRGIYEMVKAMALLPAALGAKLVLAGYFSPPGLEDELRQGAAWELVEFRGWLSREEIIVLFEQSRIGIVTLHPTPAYLESWPIKLSEYMSAGIPVIASDFPLWRQIIEGSGCGVLTDPLEPKAVGEAIAYLLLNPDEAEEMGRRGREAVVSHYNWNIEAKKLLDLYKNYLNDGERQCVE